MPFQPAYWNPLFLGRFLSTSIYIHVFNPVPSWGHQLGICWISWFLSFIFCFLPGPSNSLVYFHLIWIVLLRLLIAVSCARFLVASLHRRAAVNVAVISETLSPLHVFWALSTCFISYFWKTMDSPNSCICFETMCFFCLFFFFVKVVAFQIFKIYVDML